MKLNQLVLIAASGLASALTLQATTPPVSDRLEVVFFEPEKFTDVKDTELGDYERTTYLDQLREHLVHQSKYYIPLGQKLSVTINDVDMAGDFEPWHGVRWSDVRIVKDMYPPRISLSFQLRDAEGNILKEGKRDLRDTAFMMRASIRNEDATRYEKELLDQWLRQEFTRLPKEQRVRS